MIAALTPGDRPPPPELLTTAVLRSRMPGLSQHRSQTQIGERQPACQPTKKHPERD